MFWHLNDFFVSFHDSNVSYDSSFFVIHNDIKVWLCCYYLAAW